MGHTRVKYQNTTKQEVHYPPQKTGGEPTPALPWKTGKEQMIAWKQLSMHREKYDVDYMISRTIIRQDGRE